MDDTTAPPTDTDSVAVPELPATTRRLEDLLLDDGPRLTPAQVSEIAGVDRELADTMWRALGFPDIPEDAAVLTKSDAEALTGVKELLATGVADADTLIPVIRTIGRMVTRIADTITGTVSELVVELAVESDITTTDEAEVADVAIADVLPATLPAIDKLITYLLHRHLLASSRRWLGTRRSVENETPMAVGFADLVGFTYLSESLPTEELGVLVDRFNAVAADIALSTGGRVVKTIGDEVMFAADDVMDAVGIGLDLIDALDADEQLPPGRVGIGYGPVLVRHGDLYGPTVNAASRAGAIALPNSVLVTEAAKNGLPAGNDLYVSKLSVRNLKGIGPAQLYRVRRRRQS